MRGVHDKILKKKAIDLRLMGNSYPMIEKKLLVPRSTLNGWFSGLKISKKSEELLLNRKRRNLIIIRKKALYVLSKQRENNHRKLLDVINRDYSDLKITKQIKELLLAMLYLGEGFKRKSLIGLGNSNPRILLAFVNLLREIYNVSDSTLSCYLHLRQDQNEEKEINFWSNFIKIDKNKFRKTQFDKRTAGIKTWNNYHGVCVVYCNNAFLEKRLTIMQEMVLNIVS